MRVDPRGTSQLPALPQEPLFPNGSGMTSVLSKWRKVAKPMNTISMATLPPQAPPVEDTLCRNVASICTEIVKSQTIDSHF